MGAVGGAAKQTAAEDLTEAEQKDAKMVAAAEKIEVDMEDREKDMVKEEEVS